MCGLFTKVPAPMLNKQDLEPGLGKNQNEIIELRILNGYKILGSNSSTYPSGVKHESVSAKKSYNGGYGIQIINEIQKNYNRCDMYFMGFKEEEVRSIMDAFFTKIGMNKWTISGLQHFKLSQRGNNNFELLCSDPEGKCYA